ncbi:type II secretion system ATPase GspE [Aliamphritea ceti]|uniref:type II secretion system ATPase GspE n=1 Tax=Aliamphritea ceti TaxID=1524258 RepID=UPI0021C435B4|nr:type II secretion system ATPase GspE [Aliamphritea ceti]
MKSTPLLPFSFAYKQGVMAIRTDSQPADILYSESTSLQAIAETCRVLPAPVNYVLQSADEIQKQISLIYKEADNDFAAIHELNDHLDLRDMNLETAITEDLLDSQDDAPVIRMINVLFSQALKQKASDIHIETFEASMSVRIRVDGVLQEVLKPDYRWAPRLISRIKVMAKLDIAEKRVPQDGRVSLKMAGQALDVRVSTMPAIHGERIVLRLLEKQTRQLNFSQLGIPQQTADKLHELFQVPNGIILVTGPTGSGKTTTLYAGLSALNDKSRNILTVEDPVEYALEGVGQTPVNTKTGMSFAKGLKAILRQDPDVVMIGEIRDAETAQIAVQASLTGHLVLSTLHTNDSLGAITRLMDIGIESYLIASALKGVLAQRLIRLLCKHCKTPATLDAQLAERLGDSTQANAEVFDACGCDLCNNSGYSGRVGLYELLTVTPPLAKLIHNRASEHEIAEYAQAYVSTLLTEGRQLVLQGKTPAHEVLRTVKDSTGYAIV